MGCGRVPRQVRIDRRRRRSGRFDLRARLGSRSRGSGGHGSGRRRSRHGRAGGQAGLERIDTLGERLERQVGLRTRQARQRDLEHQARIGRRAHLDRGAVEHGEHTGQAVCALKELGLGLNRLQLGLGTVKEIRRGTGHARGVHVAHVRHQVARDLEQVAALLHLRAHEREERGHVAYGDTAGKLGEHGAGGLAQKRLGIGHANGAVSKDGELFERRERVAHAAACMACHDLQRLLVKAKAFLLAHVAQACLDVLVRDAMEVETLAAGKNGLENLLRVGGTQDEDDVRRRLLKGLEQGVERRGREHVHLVDDVDLVRAAHRRVVHRADDLFAHVVHARARSGVELVDVRVRARGDGLALGAGAVGDAAGVALGMRAQEGLGQDARHGGLARTARAAEQIRMRKAPLGDGVFERRDDMLLAHHGIKGERAVFSVERLHAASP